MANQKVNPELYAPLEESSIFPQCLGFIPGEKWNDISFKGEISSLENYRNFNPNILTYDLPFTEIIGKSAPGIDGPAKMEEIMSVFQKMNTDNEELLALSDQLEFVTTENTLLYQNVATPINSNFLSG